MAEVLVLCYHAVSERFPAPLSVTPAAFERQLALLVRAGYQGATFEAAAGGPPAPRTVVITFDDAYLSVLRLGKPLLDAVGFPATVYAPTAYLDAPDRPLSWAGIEQWIGGPHEQELLPMAWDQLGELADAGWEIGSHTRTHPHLTTLDDESLRSELVESRATVEQRLGRPCPTLAYPYGDHDERVVAAAG
ncbi:MAG: polysaccharide deacetylase family protein, partial [Thermoleophilaceae bacterium]|nr:polysaccharide deacetylase family protein [Thermoleophilaceae bacterium]